MRQENVRRRVLRPAAEEAGVPWCGFHSFRHTCASMLFEAGRNIRQVAAWLGHADPAFTLRTYVHLMDAGVGEGLDLDALGAGETSHEVHTDSMRLTPTHGDNLDADRHDSAPALMPVAGI
jgi:Phage integrase family